MQPNPAKVEFPVLPQASAIPSPAPRRLSERGSFIGILGLVVVALILLAPVINVEDTKPTGSSGLSSPAGIGPPSGLQAKAGRFSVILRWEASVSSDISGYLVFRNGDQLGDLTTRTRLVDDGLTPDEPYNYSVKAVSDSGETSHRIKASVITKAVPIRLARLTGLFSVTLKEESHYGFTALTPDRWAEWRFAPACSSGPCDVSWEYLSTQGFKAGLQRRNAVYSGGGLGQLGFSCGGVATASIVTLRLGIETGEVVDGHWQANELRGSLVERSPAQSGCVSSEIVYSFTATALPDSAEGVVAILNKSCSAAGSGFIAKPGYVVTAAHVVAGESSPVVVWRSSPFPATVAVFQPKADIAVLRVDGLVGTRLSLLSSHVEPGTTATVLGFPEGAFLTATEAIVRGFSAFGTSTYNKPVQLDTYELGSGVRHGDSGGPLVLPNGVVAGVEVRGNGHNEGYAVASTEVIPLLRRALGATTPVGTGDCIG